MEVVILCGGFGTRLPEETEFRPKPLVQVGGRPVLWHIMKYYSSFGHTDFVLSAGYKGHMIKEYFVNYELRNSDVTLQLGQPESLNFHQSHDEAGWQVTIANTGLNALKGARLKRVERYVKGDVFMLTYGDGLSNVDLEALLAFHRSHGKIATVTGINLAGRFGELKIEGERVERFREKPKSTNTYVNGGFFVFDRRIFDYLRDDDDCDLEVGAVEHLAEAGELMVHKHGGDWACMDTARDRDYLNGLWDSGTAFWKAW